MKKKLLLLGSIIAAVLLMIPTQTFAETTTADVLKKGADGAFNMKYQYATRNGDNSWPECPAGAEWYKTDFDDSGWNEKKVPFGNGLSGDQNWPGEYNCYWLRKNVDFGTIDANAQYYLITKHDDNYVVYVNGTQIVKRDGWTGGNYNWVAVDGSLLHDGNNLIAVYIQQNYGGAYFDFGVKKVNYDLSSPYAGVEPANGQDFYLYNPKSGLWLQNNDRITSDWNTRGELGVRGISFTLNYVTDGGGNNNGGYYLKSLFKPDNCPSLNAGNRYLDTDARDAWHLSKVKVPGIDNAYTVVYYPTDADDFILSSKDDSGRGNKGNNIFTPGNNYFLDTYRSQVGEQSVWVLVTEAQRKAMLESATVVNPVNATWLIKNADLSNEDSRESSWAKSNNGGDCKYIGREDNDQSRNARIYESYNSNSFDFHQVLSNMPAGIYRLKVQGFYRGGVAYMYANDNKQNLIETTSTESAAVLSRQMNRENAFVNTMEFEIEEAGNITIGVAKDAKVTGTDWVGVSKFSLEYLGHPDLSEYIEALQNAITAAEAIDQNKLTDAAKADLAAKLATANAMLTSQNRNNISDATNNLNDAVNAYKNMDITALKAAVDYMAGRDYNDDAANDVLANAITAAAVNDAVGSLKIRFKHHVAEKSVQPTQFTNMTTAVVGTEHNDYGTAVTDHADGFYLYNVGTGRWFCGGDDWGAHAAVGFPGIKVTTPENNYGTGKYNSIKTFLFNGNWNDGGQLGHNAYCDTGGNGWKFWTKDAEQGIYTISRNGSNEGNNSGNDYGRRDLLGFSDNTLMRLDSDKSGADNPNNQWIFVTEAQRDAMADAAKASADADHPVDLTWKIKMPGFNQRERKEGSNQDGETLDWTCNHANYCYNASDNGSRHAICERGGNHADFCIDIYGGQWKDAFSWTQTITNLAPGKYRVKVQGYNNGGDAANKAKLVAGNMSVVLREASSETQLPWVGRLADNTWEAVEYFQNGCYWNEVECAVGSDGELTIGVESPSITSDHVVLFDNFRLEYIGENNFAPETGMSIRSHGNWGGVAMNEADDSTPIKRHFTISDFFVNDVQQEGIFINFKNGDDWYCPASGENEVVNAGKEITEISKLDHEAKGWVVQNQTGYMKVDVYCTHDGMKVVFNDNTLEAMKDVENLYVVGEQTTGWSRSSSDCPKLEKKAAGVYEGTVEIKRDNTIIDAIRLITRPDNGDNDNQIGSLNVPVRYISGEQKLGTGSTGRMYLRKGEQKITVNFNEGTFTVDPVGVASSYVYAVGTLVDHTWQNGDTTYKLDEIEPNVFKGIVKVAQDDNSRFSLFFERTATDWNTGRVGPDNQDIKPEQGVVATNRIVIGEDRAWRVPQGEWMVTLDIANQKFLFDEIHTQTVTVSDAGYATFVAQYPFTAIPDNAKVYAAELSTNPWIKLNDMTQIPAGEAVVIKAPAATYTFTEAVTAKSDVTNDLVAATEDVTADGTQYVLAKKNDKVAFYKVTEGTTIAAGKGYLVSTEANINALYFEGDETGINDVNDNVNENQAVYNLAGQRIAKMQRGINIVNGKKIIK